MRLPVRTIVASASLALAVTATTGPTAQATKKPTPPPTPTGWATIATGLDNPRHLSFSGDWLHVAESGRGGSGPCVEGPEGQFCVGTTGAITRITARGQKRVVTGLPSGAAADGSAAGGPTDVAFDGTKYTISVGLGNDPAVRAQLGASGPLFGTVVTVKERHAKRRHGRTSWTTRPRVVADLAGYEATNDPDGAGPDSNPGGFVQGRKGLAVTDAGGNSLLLVKESRRGHRKGWDKQPSGKVSLLATFPDRLVPAPPFMPPGDIPMQAVPTSVVLGSDGAYYVSQLTGFPFPANASTVWRVVPGQRPTAYVTGLTNVTDLAWHKGSLYVVQLADQGLLAAGEELPEGSLRRITSAGTSQVIAEGLPAPYGVALQGRSAYVTTCAVCPGGGSVVKIALK